MNQLINCRFTFLSDVGRYSMTNFIYFGATCFVPNAIILLRAHQQHPATTKNRDLVWLTLDFSFILRLFCIVVNPL